MAREVKLLKYPIWFRLVRVKLRLRGFLLNLHRSPAH
jgi:hypothetical protein